MCIFSILLLSTSMRCKDITYRQNNVAFCIFVQSYRLCLLIALFILFTLEVIIDMVGFKSTICYLFSVYRIRFLFFYFPSYFFLINVFYVPFKSLHWCFSFAFFFIIFIVFALESTTEILTL